MKDYLLSEIKEYCRKRCARFSEPCKKCEMLETICKETLPVGWDIEQRNMIELPYKLYRKFSHDWQVVYFDNARYEVKIKCFTGENEADDFLQELKGKK